MCQITIQYKIRVGKKSIQMINFFFFLTIRYMYLYSYLDAITLEDKETALFYLWHPIIIGTIYYFHSHRKKDVVQPLRLCSAHNTVYIPTKFQIHTMIMLLMRVRARTGVGRIKLVNSPHPKNIIQLTWSLIALSRVRTYITCTSPASGCEIVGTQYTFVSPPIMTIACPYAV